jgi:hypothetical protein
VKEKQRRKKVGKKAEAELEKRLERGISYGVRRTHFIVFVATLIYYKSRCGRRQVAEPPKTMCYVFLFYFIIQQSPTD